MQGGQLVNHGLIILGELHQNLLHHAVSGRTIVNRGAVVHSRAVGGRRAGIGGLGTFGLGVQFGLQLFIGNGNVLHCFALQLVLQVGLLGAFDNRLIGDAVLFTGFVDGLFQLVAGQFRIGQIVALHLIPGGLPIFGNLVFQLSGFFIRQLIQTQLLDLHVLHIVFDQGVDDGIRYAGDIVSIRGIIAHAIHAVDQGHVVQLIAHLILNLALGVHIVANLDDFRGTIHGFILFDQCAAAQQHGNCQQKRKQSFLVHEKFLSVLDNIHRHSHYYSAGCIKNASARVNFLVNKR